MKDKYNEILKSAKELLANMGTDEFLDKFLKIQDGNKEKEVSVKTKWHSYRPNYMVVYDLDKEKLYKLAESTKSNQVFIIPVYTKEIEDVPNFIDAPQSEYFVKPFYSGDSDAILEGYLNMTLETLSSQDYVYWKPIRDYVDKEIDKKGFREACMAKLPHIF